MDSWWNGVGTGVLTIGLGAFLFVPTYRSWRRKGEPFVEPRIIGGYNGVVGIAFMGVGVVILAVSLFGLAWLVVIGR